MSLVESTVQDIRSLHERYGAELMFIDNPMTIPCLDFITCNHWEQVRHGLNSITEEYKLTLFITKNVKHSHYISLYDRSGALI